MGFGWGSRKRECARESRERERERERERPGWANVGDIAAATKASKFSSKK